MAHTSLIDAERGCISLALSEGVVLCWGLGTALKAEIAGQSVTWLAPHQFAQAGSVYCHII